MNEVALQLAPFVTGCVAGIFVCAAILKLVSWKGFNRWLASAGLVVGGRTAEIAAGIVLMEAVLAALLVSSGHPQRTLALALMVSTLLIAGRLLLGRLGATDCPCLGEGNERGVKRVAAAMAIFAVCSGSLLIILLANPSTGVHDWSQLASVASGTALVLGAFLFGNSARRPVLGMPKKVSSDAARVSRLRELVGDVPSAKAIVVFVAPDCRGCGKILEVIVGLQPVLPEEHSLFVHMLGFETAGAALGEGIHLIPADDRLMRNFSVRATPSLVLAEGDHFWVTEGVADCIGALGEIIASR